MGCFWKQVCSGSVVGFGKWVGSGEYGWSWEVWFVLGSGNVLSKGGVVEW